MAMNPSDPNGPSPDVPAPAPANDQAGAIDAAGARAALCGLRDHIAACAEHMEYLEQAGLIPEHP